MALYREPEGDAGRQGQEVEGDDDEITTVQPYGRDVHKPIAQPIETADAPQLMQPTGSKRRKEQRNTLASSMTAANACMDLQSITCKSDNTHNSSC